MESKKINYRECFFLQSKKACRKLRGFRFIKGVIEGTIFNDAELRQETVV